MTAIPVIIIMAACGGALSVWATGEPDAGAVTFVLLAVAGGAYTWGLNRRK